MIYEQRKTIDQLVQLEIRMEETIRQQGIVINRMQGQLAKYKANLDRLLTGLNERDCIVKREEKKIHERLNCHHYDIQEQDKVIQGIDRKVGIQAQEIDVRPTWKTGNSGTSDTESTEWSTANATRKYS